MTSLWHHQDYFLRLPRAPTKDIMYTAVFTDWILLMMFMCKIKYGYGEGKGITGTSVNSLDRSKTDIYSNDCSKYCKWLLSGWKSGLTAEAICTSLIIIFNHLFLLLTSRVTFLWAIENRTGIIEYCTFSQQKKINIRHDWKIKFCPMFTPSLK